MYFQGAQYIGEICRYLLSVPESPEERSHGVEIMFGNGLRPQIWQQFVNRFIFNYVKNIYNFLMYFLIGKITVYNTSYFVYQQQYLRPLYFLGLV